MAATLVPSDEEVMPLQFVTEPMKIGPQFVPEVVEAQTLMVELKSEMHAASRLPFPDEATPPQFAGGVGGCAYIHGMLILETCLNSYNRSSARTVRTSS